MYRFPEVAEPSINQASCGQIARATPEPAPPGTIEPFEGQTVDVIAQNLAFDKRQITVNPGGQLRVRLDNRDPAVQHNIAFYQSATNTTAPLAPGSIGTIFPGVAIDDTAFAIPGSGNYFFRCDVHPTTMTGTFTVN
jgi:plastocyanin